MSIEDQLACIADASERTADALEKILSILEARPAAPKEPAPVLPVGPLLNRDGVVSNVYGEFNTPVGRIDLDRLVDRRVVGLNAPGRVWTLLLGHQYKESGDERATIAVRKIEAFVEENRGAQTRYFGANCDKVVRDWYAQLRDLLK